MASTAAIVRLGWAAVNGIAPVTPQVVGLLLVWGSCGVKPYSEPQDLAMENAEPVLVYDRIDASAGIPSCSWGCSLL